MFITQDVWNIPTFDFLSDDLVLRMNISVSIDRRVHVLLMVLLQTSMVR